MSKPLQCSECSVLLNDVISMLKTISRINETENPDRHCYLYFIGVEIGFRKVEYCVWVTVFHSQSQGFYSSLIDSQPWPSYFIAFQNKLPPVSVEWLFVVPLSCTKTHTCSNTLNQTVVFACNLHYPPGCFQPSVDYLLYLTHIWPMQMIAMWATIV